MMKGPAPQHATCLYRSVPSFGPSLTRHRPSSALTSAANLSPRSSSSSPSIVARPLSLCVLAVTVCLCWSSSDSLLSGYWTILVYMSTPSDRRTLFPTPPAIQQQQQHDVSRRPRAGSGASLSHRIASHHIAKYRGTTKKIITTVRGQRDQSTATEPRPAESGDPRCTVLARGC